MDTMQAPYPTSFWDWITGLQQSFSFYASLYLSGLLTYALVYVIGQRDNGLDSLGGRSAQQRVSR